MPASTYLANKIIDHLLKGTAWTQPANLYAGLLSATPSTELSGNGYARVQAQSWDPAASGASQNASVIEFPVATGNWVQAVAVAIYDASSGGNLLFYGNLTTPRTVTTGVKASFAIGDFDVSIP